MSDTPKFEVIDRRKIKAEEEQEHHEPAEPQAAAEPPAGPRLVVSETREAPAPTEPSPTEPSVDALEEELTDSLEGDLPPAPTVEESLQQKAAYEAAAERIEDLVRAQNPGVGKQPAASFEHLVQQFYVSCMIQMGAGAQEGQRPRVDIMGARNTIDMLGILAEKTRGNLSEAEDRILQTVLFETRMAFLELSSMINMQGVQPPPPGKR